MTLKAIKHFVRFPLGPNKIIIFPAVVIAHRPPEAGLERCSHDARVVASADVVLVRRELGIRELYLLDAIRLQDFNQELTVVLFLQLQVPLFVLRVRKVLGKLLQFLGQVL